MISSKQLQTAYNHLYKYLREYIWPANIVSHIADLEIETYKSFPDLEELSSRYNRLKSECLRYIDDDEDLKAAFEEYREILDSSNELYSKLNTRLEGVEYHENFQE